MQDYKRKEYKVFELFDKKWALVTAGNIQHYNCCTVSWGSLGNIWGTAGNSRSTVTVYVHPARYTSEVLKESDIFTVSFYPETSRKALGYLGSHSGRNENKIETVGFTPVKMGLPKICYIFQYESVFFTKHVFFMTIYSRNPPVDEISP